MNSKNEWNVSFVQHHLTQRAKAIQVHQRVLCKNDVEEQVFFRAKNFILQNDISHFRAMLMKCQCILICHPITTLMPQVQNLCHENIRQ
jgi:hypothetical protein